MTHLERRIFISHATADKDIADALVDLLKTGADVRTAQIFCASLEGYGVPEGEDFVEYIRTQIESPVLVVAVISPAYYESAFCVCELGAAWAMQHSLFPVVVPPLTYGELQGVISKTQGGYIKEAAKLDNLRDRVLSVLGIAPVATALWNDKRDQFLVRMDELLDERPPLKRVPAADLEALKGKYKAALKKLKDGEAELVLAKAQMEAVSALKDRADVAHILVAGDESAEFERLLEDAKKKIRRLPRVVREALFHHYSGTAYSPDGMDRSAWDDIQKEVEAKFLREPEGRVVQVNLSDKAVGRAVEAVVALDSFFRRATAPFHTWFEGDADYDADVTSSRFWKDYLGVQLT